jgi:hypothetical protein
MRNFGGLSPTKPSICAQNLIWVDISSLSVVAMWLLDCSILTQSNEHELNREVRLEPAPDNTGAGYSRLK